MPMKLTLRTMKSPPFSAGKAGKEPDLKQHQIKPGWPDKTQAPGREGMESTATTANCKATDKRTAAIEFERTNPAKIGKDKLIGSEFM